MNGDEVVRKSTLYLLFHLHSQSRDVWTRLCRVEIVTFECPVGIAYRERVS
jgi:hypothetical protein